MEIGKRATAWTLAPEESNVNSSNYSWKFSPREGMYMWNGSQTGAPVLKIDSNGLYMNGEIWAKKGNIGGYTISSSGLTYTTGTSDSNGYAYTEFS